MDPLSIIVSIEALVAAVLTLSKATSSALGAIKDAPAHFNALKNDLADFYSILGRLQGLINDARRSTSRSPDALRTTNFDLLENTLKNTITSFNNISVILNKFKALDRTKDVVKWKSPKWMFIESSVESFRKDLMNSKVTLNTEISILSWSTTNTVYKTVDRIEGDLRQHHHREELYRFQLSERLENLEATGLNQSPSHTEADRANIKYDPHYSLRHHLDSAAASIISDGLERSSASFIVSDLGDHLESATTSDEASFFSAFSRHSRISCDHDFPDDSIKEKTSEPHPTIKLSVFEVLVQTHTGAKLKVQVTQEDTPQTVLSRLQKVDGFWSYWSERGYLMYAGKAVKPDEELRPFLGSTTPTFSFRTGHSTTLFQENIGKSSARSTPRYT